MPPINWKRVIIVILAIIALSRIDRLIHLARVIVRAFWDAMEPLRDSPVEGQYVVGLAFLALIYVTLFKLLQGRK
jgi:hypothetical protein